MILSFILLFIYVDYKRTSFLPSEWMHYRQVQPWRKGFLCLCTMELPMVDNPIWRENQCRSYTCTFGVSKLPSAFGKCWRGKDVLQYLDIDSLSFNYVCDFSSFGPLLDCVLFDFKTSSNDLVNHLNLKPWTKSMYAVLLLVEKKLHWFSGT